MASKIESSIKKGNSFSQSIIQMSEYFDPMVSGMLSLGEKSTSIYELILNLRIFMETRKKTREKIIGAFIYPSIVFVSLISFILICGFYILPKMQDMFLILSTTGSDELTSNITAMKDFSRFFLTVTLALLTLSALVFIIERKASGEYRLLIDKFLLGIPFSEAGKADAVSECFFHENLRQENFTV